MDAITYFEELHRASLSGGNLLVKMKNNGFSSAEIAIAMNNKSQLGLKK